MGNDNCSVGRVVSAFLSPYLPEKGYVADALRLAAFCCGTRKVCASYVKVQRKKGLALPFATTHDLSDYRLSSVRITDNPDTIRHSRGNSMARAFLVHLKHNVQHNRVDPPRCRGSGLVASTPVAFTGRRRMPVSEIEILEGMAL
jgi:hypothetical protein